MMLVANCVQFYQNPFCCGVHEGCVPHDINNCLFSPDGAHMANYLLRIYRKEGKVSRYNTLTFESLPEETIEHCPTMITECW